MLLKNFYNALSMMMSNQTLGETVSTSGSANGYAGYSYAPTLLKLYNAMTTVKANTTQTGVVFGSGNTAPSLTDYCLDALITTCSGSGALTVEHDADALVTTFTSVLTITNTGDEDITIAEVGLQIVTTGNWAYMLDRTVLDSPVTIPAGGVGQVTYTIRMEYPK